MGLTTGLERTRWHPTTRGLRALVHRHQDVVVALTPLAAAVALWMPSVRDIELDRMTDIGLMSVLPISAFVALALLTVSFVVTLLRDDLPRWVPGLHVAVLVLLIHATPAAIYETIRYSWAYKHVGIVDYVQRYGAVDPHMDALGVYHNWPGFFALSAMLVEAAGFESALSFAAWATPVFDLLFVALVALIARELLDDDRLVVLAAWLFVITNWVGQDYFAPQTLAYFWYLTIIFIVLRWLGHTSDSRMRERFIGFARRRMPFAIRYIAPLSLNWHDRLITTSLTNPIPREWVDDPDRTSPGRLMALLTVTLLLVWGVVSVHQLTPIVLVVALVALLLGSRLYVGTLPLLVSVLTAGWLIDVAEPFTVANLTEAAETVGAVSSNISGTLIGYGEVSTGQVVVSLMARSLTLAIGLLAVAGFFRSMRRERLGPIVVLAVAPASLVAINGYGSEVLFRIYLFALPFLVIIAAAALLRPRHSADWRSATAILTVSLLLGTLFLFAYFGNDQRYRFTPLEVAASTFVAEHAPFNTLLVEGSRNYPGQLRNYERFVYVPITRESVETRERITTAPVDELSRWLSNERYADAYIIITRSQKAESNSLGELPNNGLARIERALKASPTFELVYGNADASVFQLADEPAARS